VLSAASVIEDQLQDAGIRYRAALLTFTYREGAAWNPRQISEALRRARQYCERRGWFFHCVWRFEFGSARGRPHYHVVVWLPRGVTLPKFDNQGWWPHGMTNAKWARRPVGYIAKYAAAEASFPPGFSGTRGARWFGVVGLGAIGRLRARWRAAPGWVRKWIEEGDPLRRLPGSWWLIGAWRVRSPWRCKGVDPDGCLKLTFAGWREEDLQISAS
jgi:hypothetical protein